MSTTTPDRFTGRTQVKGRYDTVNQGISRKKRARMAEVIHLYPKAGSTRITTRQEDVESAAPPPVTVPYGWKLVSRAAGAKTVWSFVKDQEQWGVISWLILERRAGRSYRDLADELEEDGVEPPTGGRSVGRWHQERVRTLVQYYAPDTVPAPPVDPFVARLQELMERGPENCSDEEHEELHTLAHDIAREAGESCPICNPNP